MSDAKRFDLIVIGGGTGGNGVARMAAKAGWAVASIDSLPFGGTCALRGCDPKKMLIAVTEGVEWARSLDGKSPACDLPSLGCRPVDQRARRAEARRLNGRQLFRTHQNGSRPHQSGGLCIFHQSQRVRRQRHQAYSIRILCL